MQYDHVVYGSRLGRNCLRVLLKKVGLGSPEGKRLYKRRCTAESDTGSIYGDIMERLRPPLKCKDSKSGDGRDVAGEPLDLLREGAEGDTRADPDRESEQRVAEEL